MSSGSAGLPQMMMQSFGAILDDTTYTLDVFVGHRTSFNWPATVYIAFTVDGVIADSSHKLVVADPTQGKWAQPSLAVDLSSYAGQILGIVLAVDGVAGSKPSIQVNWDNVRLSYVTEDPPTPPTQETPIPGTFPLMATVLGGGFVMWRRRKRRTQA